MRNRHTACPTCRTGSPILSGAGVAFGWGSSPPRSADVESGRGKPLVDMQTFRYLDWQLDPG